MNLDPDLIKTIAPGLRDRDSLPPRDAFLALVALTGDADVPELLTLQLGKGWQILAASEAGLAVLQVDSGPHGFWSLSERKPNGAGIDARLYPWRAVERIEVREVEIYAGMVETNLDISGRFSYTVVLADGTTLELPRDPDNRQGAVVGFIDALRKRL